MKTRPAQDTVQAKNDGENLAYQVDKQLTELKDGQKFRKKMSQLRKSHRIRS